MRNLFALGLAALLALASPAALAFTQNDLPAYEDTTGGKVIDSGIPYTGIDFGRNANSYVAQNHVYTNSDAGKLVNRSNAGVVMADALPNNITNKNAKLTIANTDGAAFLTIYAGAGVTIDGGNVILGPGQIASFSLDDNGTTWHTINKPTRIWAPSNVTLYADSVSGSDLNNCTAASNVLGPVGPCATIQRAYNQLQSLYDIGSFSATIHANGAFGTTSFQPRTVGGGDFVTIQFTTGSTVHATGTDYGLFAAYGAVIAIQADGPGGVTISADGNACIKSTTESIITVTTPYINLGPCGGPGLYASEHGHINTNSTIYPQGNMSALIEVCFFGLYDGGATWNFQNGLINFSGATAYACNGGQLGADEVFQNAGNVTGQRYFATQGGTIFGTHGNLTYFPGNAHGNTEDGGVYEPN